MCSFFFFKSHHKDISTPFKKIIARKSVYHCWRENWFWSVVRMRNNFEESYSRLLDKMNVVSKKNSADMFLHWNMIFLSQYINPEIMHITNNPLIKKPKLTNELINVHQCFYYSQKLMFYAWIKWQNKLSYIGSTAK